MCEADLECRRLAPAWKLVTIVFVLSFDCCVVPPEALASYAQELDEIVHALFPLFVEQDRLESHAIKRMRLPRNARGFDVTPMHLRSPMAFLENTWQLLPVWPRQLEFEQWKHWRSSEQPRTRKED